MAELNKQARQVQRYTNYGVDMMEWDDGKYVKYSDYLARLDEIEAAEKRIAELESRTVTLPDVEKWRSVDAVRAQNAYKVLVSKTLATAGVGIGMKGE